MKNKIFKIKKQFSIFILIFRRDGFFMLFKRLCEKIYAVSIVNFIEYVKTCISRRNLKKVVFHIETEKTHKITKKVDVIVCVHNALEDVKRCLDSVVKFSGSNYSLIIVDDGSSYETEDFLIDFAKNNKVKLIRNERALGYTFSANIGLRNSLGDYVVLLNSDTIVTPKWLEKMVECGESDSKIGLVGPLSNTASWQSVPKILENGDWAENPLPENINLQDWAKLIEENAGKIYPVISFLNGFCLMIKRETMHDVGIFDEENFGRGYGEENDYCLRARKNGWKLAVADDTYIFHAQSKSYSNEKRRVLSAKAGKILENKHGKGIIQEGVEYCAKDKIMEGIRVRVEALCLFFIDNSNSEKKFNKETSYDLNLFRPRPKKTRIIDDAIRVIFVAGSSTTAEVLRIVKEQCKSKIDVVSFSLNTSTSSLYRPKGEFNFNDLGQLTPQQMSRLFNESDIFVDFSLNKDYDVVSAEAMASGLAVAISKGPNTFHFAKDKINSLVVESYSKDICVKALLELIGNNNLRESISRQAVKDVFNML